MPMQYLPYHAGAWLWHIYDYHIFLDFAVAIPSLLSLPGHMSKAIPSHSVLCVLSLAYLVFCANTDLLFRLRFIHCAMESPFIIYCFPFSLTGEQNVRNRWRGVDELYGLYLLCHANGQMHMYLIASSVKVITKHVFVVYRFKSARMVSCWDLYACSRDVIGQYSCC